MPKPSAGELANFYVALDQVSDLRGAGVAYVGDGICATLRHSAHWSGLSTYVILQEGEIDGNATPDAATVKKNKPSLAVELVGLGLNCGGAVLSWMALLGEGAAAPVSGGTSLALTVVTYTAAVATTAQCANSLIRSADVKFHHAEWTEWLDSQQYYQLTSDALDGISLVGAAAAGALTVKMVLALRKASTRSFLQILKGLSRAERKRLTQEMIRMQVPGISNSAMKATIRAGNFPARFTAAQIGQGIFNQLRDAISATLAFTGSAVAGDVKLLYVHIVQE
jgi:hypothetical protein